MKVVLSSDEINVLVYTYLIENGYAHSAFAFNAEAALASCPAWLAHGDQIFPNALIAFLQKAMLYLWIEHHTDEETGEEIRCSEQFSFFKRHSCRCDPESDPPPSKATAAPNLDFQQPPTPRMSNVGSADVELGAAGGLVSPDQQMNSHSGANADSNGSRGRGGFNALANRGSPSLWEHRPSELSSAPRNGSGATGIGGSVWRDTGPHPARGQNPSTAASTGGSSNRHGEGDSAEPGGGGDGNREGGGSAGSGGESGVGDGIIDDHGSGRASAAMKRRRVGRSSRKSKGSPVGADGQRLHSPSAASAAGQTVPTAEASSATAHDIVNDDHHNVQVKELKAEQVPSTIGGGTVVDNRNHSSASESYRSSSWLASSSSSSQKVRNPNAADATGGASAGGNAGDMIRDASAGHISLTQRSSQHSKVHHQRHYSGKGGVANSTRLRRHEVDDDNDDDDDDDDDIADDGDDDKRVEEKENGSHDGGDVQDDASGEMVGAAEGQRGVVAVARQDEGRIDRCVTKNSNSPLSSSSPPEIAARVGEFWRLSVGVDGTSPRVNSSTASLLDATLRPKPIRNCFQLHVEEEEERDADLKKNLNNTCESEVLSGTAARMGAVCPTDPRRVAITYDGGLRSALFEVPPPAVSSSSTSGECHSIKLLPYRRLASIEDMVTTKIKDSSSSEGQGGTSLVWMPDGSAVACGMENGTVLMWTPSGELMHVFELPRNVPPLAGMSDGGAQDANTGDCDMVDRANDPPIADVANDAASTEAITLAVSISPNGKFLAAAHCCVLTAKKIETATKVPPAGVTGDVDSTTKNASANHGDDGNQCLSSGADGAPGGLVCIWHASAPYSLVAVFSMKHAVRDLQWVEAMNDKQDEDDEETESFIAACGGDEIRVISVRKTDTAGADMQVDYDDNGSGQSGSVGESSNAASNSLEVERNDRRGKFDGEGATADERSGNGVVAEVVATVNFIWPVVAVQWSPDGFMLAISLDVGAEETVSQTTASGLAGGGGSAAGVERERYLESLRAYPVMVWSRKEKKLTAALRLNSVAACVAWLQPLIEGAPPVLVCCTWSGIICGFRIPHITSTSSTASLTDDNASTPTPLSSNREESSLRRLNKPLFSVSCGTTSFGCISVSPSRKRFAVGGSDRSVRVFATGSWRIVKMAVGPAPITHVSWSADEWLLVAVSGRLACHFLSLAML